MCNSQEANVSRNNYIPVESVCGRMQIHAKCAFSAEIQIGNHLLKLSRSFIFFQNVLIV